MKFSRRNTQLAFIYHDDNDPLNGISLIEESMISPVNSFVVIERIQKGELYANTSLIITIGGQCKTRSNCTLFLNWDGVKQVATRLPRHVTDVKVKFSYPAKRTAANGETETGETITGQRAIKTLYYDVSADRIRRALVWLVDNNPLYRHVHIDEECIDHLREDCRRMAAMPDPDLDSIFADMDNGFSRQSTCLPEQPLATADIPQVLSQQYGSMAVEKNGELVRAHELANLLGMLFPTLFPDAVSGDYRNYRVPLTTAQMMKHCCSFADTRCARNYRFVFTMVNIKNMEAAFGSIGLCLRGRISKHREDGSQVEVTDTLLEEISKPVCHSWTRRLI